MGGDPSRVMGRRFLAWLVDGFIAFSVFWLVATALGVSMRTDATEVGGLAFEGDATAVAFALVLPAIYFIGAQVLAQGLLGWTPGKLLLGIRLVGWDGRPPGLWRAFVHAFVVNAFVSVLSCIGGLILLIWTQWSKYHQHLGDVLAKTYVVDAPAMGRLMMRTSTGLQVGMVSIKREELASLLGEEEAAAMLPDIVGKPTQPVFDKNRNTYVVWRPKAEQWLEFDDATQSWKPFE